MTTQTEQYYGRRLALVWCLAEIAACDTAEPATQETT